MTSIPNPIADNVDEAGECPVCGAAGGSCREAAMLRSGLMEIRETSTGPKPHPIGIRIVRLDEKRGTPMYKLKAKTFVNRDSTKVVPEGSAEAAFLLGLEGDEISDETAKRLGLVNAAGESYSSRYAGMTIAAMKAEIEGRDDVDVDQLPAKPKHADLVAALEAADAKGNAPAGGTADQGEADATDGTKQADGPAEA